MPLKQEAHHCHLICLPVCVCVCQVLADAVSRLVVEKFSELTDNFTSPHARRKVLAGVVMTTGIQIHNTSSA